MKILHLNVNNFGGSSSKPLLTDYKYNGETDWDVWNNAVDDWRYKNKNNILKNVQSIADISKDFDVIFLCEVDTNCESWYKLHELMKDQYTLLLPNGTDLSEYQKGRKSISCLFIKKDIKYEYTNDNFLKFQRNVEIKIGDIHIIGLHMNYAIEDWDKLIKKYQSLKDEKLLIIGDLNVYARGTDRREKFDILFNEENKAIDLWVAQDEREETPTFGSGDRIDYAIATPKLYEENAPRESILDNIRCRKISDHEGIAVELSENP